MLRFFGFIAVTLLAINVSGTPQYAELRLAYTDLVPQAPLLGTLQYVRFDWLMIGLYGLVVLALFTHSKVSARKAEALVDAFSEQLRTQLEPMRRRVDSLQNVAQIGIIMDALNKMSTNDMTRDKVLELGKIMGGMNAIQHVGNDASSRMRPWDSMVKVAGGIATIADDLRRIDVRNLGVKLEDIKGLRSLLDTINSMPTVDGDALASIASTARSVSELAALDHDALERAEKTAGKLGDVIDAVIEIAENHDMDDVKTAVESVAEVSEAVRKLAA